MAGQVWQPGLSPCAARGCRGRGYTCTRIKERVLRCVALHVLACRWGFAQPSAARIVCSVGGMCCLASHFPGRAVLGARSTGLCAGQHKAISSAHFPVGAHCMLSSFRRWRQRPRRPARRPGGRGPRSPHASRGCKVGEGQTGTDDGRENASFAHCGPRFGPSNRLPNPRCVHCLLPCHCRARDSTPHRGFVNPHASLSELAASTSKSSGFTPCSSDKKGGLMVRWDAAWDEQHSLAQPCERRQRRTQLGHTGHAR